MAPLLSCDAAAMYQKGIFHPDSRQPLPNPQNFLLQSCKRCILPQGVLSLQSLPAVYPGYFEQDLPQNT